MTPYELNILIHVHTCPDHFKVGETELLNSTIKEFLSNGAITHDSDSKNGYGTTDLGKAWLISILKTKIPKIVYMDEQNQPIKFY